MRAMILFHMFASICQTMLIAAAEAKSTYVVVNYSRLQLCQWEFPSPSAELLTDEAQSASESETPPLSPTLCLTTSALY